MQNPHPTLNDARAQLNLVLSFFSRIDAKLSAILAIDTGMLAAMAAKIPSAEVFSTWLGIAPAVAIALIATSYWFLYRGGFPTLKGGESSLIYFREIAKRTEPRFVDEYQQQTEEDLVKDVLNQTWRNSVILSDKFRSLKIAFVNMAVAVLPWAVSVATFSISGAQVHSKVLK